MLEGQNATLANRHKIDDYRNIGTATELAEPPEIRNQLSRAKSQLQELRGMAETLRERLEPAMRPSVPVPSGVSDCAKIARSKSQYADQIDGLRTETQDVMAVIGDCLNRLEV